MAKNMKDENKMIVIFQGIKFFWRARNTIDVTIIEHHDFKLTEVVCYEPSLDMEATRIYLDSVVLDTKIDHHQIEKKLSFAKQNNVPHTEKFVSDIAYQATSEYIINRLFQTDFSMDSKIFEVAFQLTFRDLNFEDEDDTILQLIREPPSDLVPYLVRHNKIFSSEEKSEALKALEEAKQILREHCAAAMALQTQPAAPLSHKERWRIPIVLTKLSHNRRLSDEDRKIWKTVAGNLKTQQDIERIADAAVPQVPQTAVLPASGSTSMSRLLSPVGRATAAVAAAAISVARTATKSPRHTPNQSPARSPCVTPRSPSNSRRIMADTASSQRRVNSCIEDNTHHKLARKLAKTGKTKSCRRPSSRQRARSHQSENSEHSGHISDCRSTTSDHQDNELSGLSGAASSGCHTPTVATATAACAQDTVSFMSQLIAKLNFTLTSNHHKVHEAPMLNSDAHDCGSADHSELSVRRRHLGALNAHLLATTSTAPSLKAEFAMLNGPKPSHSEQSGKATTGLLRRSITAEMSGKEGEGGECTPLPRKRTSLLGSFLALATPSARAHAILNHSTNLHFSSPTMSAVDASAQLSQEALTGWQLSGKRRRASSRFRAFEWLLSGSRRQSILPVDSPALA